MVYWALHGVYIKYYAMFLFVWSIQSVEEYELSA